MNIKTKDGKVVKLIQFVHDPGTLTSKAQRIACCITRDYKYIEVPASEIVEIGK